MFAGYAAAVHGSFIDILFLVLFFFFSFFLSEWKKNDENVSIYVSLIRVTIKFRRDINKMDWYKLWRRIERGKSEE